MTACTVAWTEDHPRVSHTEHACEFDTAGPHTRHECRCGLTNYGAAQ